MAQTYMLRMMTTGLDAWKLSMQVAETLVASQIVISTRLAMTGAGFSGLGKPPLAELSRMVPEKAAAFSSAGMAASQALMRKGKAPMTLSGAWLADNRIMLDWLERSIDVAEAWWLPVHMRATANAKRLSRRRF